MSTTILELLHGLDERLTLREGEVPDVPIFVALLHHLAQPAIGLLARERAAAPERVEGRVGADARQQLAGVPIGSFVS